jgi:GNAT superfamily N-acetyltransferase
VQLTGEERRRLDAIAAAATPGTIELDVAGWQVKASPDLPFRRSNVAIPAPRAANDLDAAHATLAAVRQALAQHGRRLVIAISSARPDADRLDAWLADEGLDLEAPVEIMVTAIDPASIRTTAAHAPSSGLVIEVAAGADRIAPQPCGPAAPAPDARHREAGYRTLLRRIDPAGPRTPIAVVARTNEPGTAGAEGDPVGIGFAVVDGAWVGIFGMRTDPEHRRRGIASALVGAIVRAAAEHGATAAYLQVEDDNAAAIACYERLGFATSHRHHYRTEPAVAETAEPPRTAPVAEAGC